MDERRGDQAEARARAPKDEPPSPPLPRLQLYQKTRSMTYKDEAFGWRMGCLTIEDRALTYGYNRRQLFTSAAPELARAGRVALCFAGRKPSREVDQSGIVEAL